MRSRHAHVGWTGPAFAVSLCTACGILALAGAGAHGTGVALRATARLAFLLFWPAYAGASLATLFGPRFQSLRRRGGQFGLAFAAAQSVHMGLVAWLCWIGAAPAASVFVIFGIALFWTCCLVLFSVARLQGLLRGTAWWIVRRVGMNYIAFAFAFDFLRHRQAGSVMDIIEYLPFSILSVAGPILYVSALAWRQMRQSQETLRKEKAVLF